MAGEYMRNFDDFLNLDSGALLKVWLTGGSSKVTKANMEAAVTSGVLVRGRLDDEQYQKVITGSVVFLSLDADGIASTLLVECIQSSTPILLRRYEVAKEYLGEEYPLFFDSIAHAGQLLTQDKIEAAREYMNKMDKRRFSPDYFIEALVQSAAYQLVSCKPSIDVTVCLMSYKRTHNIERILKVSMGLAARWHSVMLILGIAL